MARMVVFRDLKPCILGNANVIWDAVSFTVREFSEMPPFFRRVRKIAESDYRLR